MKFLKALCLITCAWWCWLHLSVASRCYSASGNLLRCMDHMEVDMKEPMTSAVEMSRQFGR